MAAITSAQNGNWSSTSTWTGGTIPGDGDTVTINHTVTMDGSRTVGNSPATDVAVLTIGNGSASARLILSTGTLTVKGQLTDTQSHAAGVTMNAGTAIVFDATGASGTINYSIKIASSYDGGQSPGDARGWRINGTSGSHCSISSAGDGTRNAYHNNAAFGGEGCIQATYCDFTNIGDSSRNALNILLDNRQLTSSLTNCTFTSCGQINAPFTNGVPSFSMTDVTIASSLTNESTSWPITTSSGSDQTTGTRAFTRVATDKMIKVVTAHGMTFDSCYFGNGLLVTSSKNWTAMKNCFIRQTFDNIAISGSVTNCFLFWDNPSGSNPHFLASILNPPANTTYDWSDNVAYFNGTNSSGNVFLVGSTTTSTFTVNCRRNLILPNGGGSNTGALLTSNGSVTAGLALYIDHNTVNVEGQCGLEIGHLYTSVETPNRYASVKSNLFYGTTSTGYKAYNVDSSSTQDLMSPANVDYNAGYLTKTTSNTSGFTNEGRGYASKWSTTPGVNDLDGQNPVFEDSTRTLASWAVTRGSASSTTTQKEADAVSYIVANPALTTSSLLPYLKAGFKPTSSSYRTAAHDTGTIGSSNFSKTSRSLTRLAAIRTSINTRYGISV
ncbi:MAG: hypothetical protein KBD00_04025 [Candidatus Peribacteraceae bacterium]|nr:hypothetical protein [Candidatus Peribacteraceae bacterium]